nr:MAG TPA: hypothetical protein [Caudoviricetes sp.]
MSNTLSPEPSYTLQRINRDFDLSTFLLSVLQTSHKFLYLTPHKALPAALVITHL